MKYAIISLMGHQHKIIEGDEILVDKLGEEKPQAKVLMVVDNGAVKLGKPTVDGASVTFKVLSEEEKGDKLYVKKFRAKSRYRRKMGFRPQYTRLGVEKIST